MIFTWCHMQKPTNVSTSLLLFLETKQKPFKKPNNNIIITEIEITVIYNYLAKSPRITISYIPIFNATYLSTVSWYVFNESSVNNCDKADLKLNAASPKL